jgi:hypothetical protein
MAEQLTSPHACVASHNRAQRAPARASTQTAPGTHSSSVVHDAPSGVNPATGRARQVKTSAVSGSMVAQ